MEVLAALGRPDLIRDWARIYGDGYEETLEKAEANARLRQGPRPMLADISALVDEYGALLKTPNATTSVRC